MRASAGPGERETEVPFNASGGTRTFSRRPFTSAASFSLALFDNATCLEAAYDGAGIRAETAKSLISLLQELFSPRRLRDGPETRPNV